MALLIETSNAYGRGLLRGIVSYVRESRHWSISLGEFSYGAVVPERFKDWRGDGVIARVETDEMAKLIAHLDRPTVDVSAAQLAPGTPCVETDDVAIATLAFEHFLERGFTQFAFVGDARLNWSALRRSRFVELAAAAGHPCHVYQPHAPVDPHSRLLDVNELSRWVQKLPKPLAVMAAWDGYGRQLLDACGQCGVAVPDEVAVVGVDNDEVICELSDPPLSSINPDTHRTGYAAARLLDRMMSGEKVPAKLETIFPLGIVTRQSTDVLAINDRRISDAVRFIREHACDAIGVDEVAQAVSLSRRALETRFRRFFDRSPHQEILRVQLQRVKQLLAETDWTLATIARRSGFQYRECMSVAFRRVVGMPPGEYRRQLQPPVSAADRRRRP